MWMKKIHCCGCADPMKPRKDVVRRRTATVRLVLVLRGSMLSSIPQVMMRASYTRCYERAGQRGSFIELVWTLDSSLVSKLWIWTGRYDCAIVGLLRS